jgi:hypothetical protein
MEALKMETPMTEWNNDRLDERFDKVDERFDHLEGEMKAGFAEVDKRFEQVDERFVRLEGEMKAGFAKVDDRFEKLNERFDRIYYLIVMTFVGLAGSLLASNIWG